MLHAAIQFRDGERRIASRILPAISSQARVDTYLVLLLFVASFARQRVSRADRRWLRFHLFEAQNPGAFQDENLRSRYLKRPNWPRATPLPRHLNGLPS
jgi:hypothetical protein